jgi:hypothetical protein
MQMQKLPSGCETVLQVMANIQHDENTCPPGCCLTHTFCTVKLSVPDPTTRSQIIVEVGVDLPKRLQLGSFCDFAKSDQVEDAWVHLSAGQSSELTMLSQMLSKSKTAEQATCLAATVAPSKTLLKASAANRIYAGTISS